MAAKSTAKRVRDHIAHGRRGHVWTYSNFRDLSPMAVAAALSRLAKEGFIRRVRKGVYVRPRETRFGSVLPERAEITRAILESRGIKSVATGLPVYNRLGLTTQVSPVATFAVARDAHTPKTSGDDRVRFRKVSRVRGLSSEGRGVLDALRDIKTIPDTTPQDTFRRIEAIFRTSDLSFSNLAKAAIHEPPRVRALMGAIGSRLGKSTESLQKLRNSLNGTTRFKLGIGDSFPEARQWAIR